MGNSKDVTRNSNVMVKPLSVLEEDFAPMFSRCLNAVREDMRDNPYILEALRVLPVRGYRSAIGSFWNAVVDDLRNKIIARSLKLFNKSVELQREVKSYEDFQNSVNDDQLIEGAYKIGVIGWEASKLLKHAKETRHIFDGHPRSSEPSIIKVLAMMEDCVKYVLNAEYPPPIIDIDEYMTMLSENKFDRNPISAENAFSDLPENYMGELANRLFGAYSHSDASTTVRSNIEFVAPILWSLLSKSTKRQVIQRVDQIIAKGNADLTQQAFSFVRVVDGTIFLSATAKKYKLAPVIEQLQEHLDEWDFEDNLVKQLEPYASVVPAELLSRYVSAIVHTYVGRIGFSLRYSRTDFYADQAASRIPSMIQSFDDRAAEAFVACIRNSNTLRTRIVYPIKLRRLRSLGRIVLEKVSENFSDRKTLEALVDETKEEKFMRLIGLAGTSK